MIIGNWLHPTLCHHHLLLCRSEKRTPGKKEIWLTWIVHLLRRCWLQLRIPDRNWIGAWATTMMPAVWASQYVTSLLLKSQEVTFMPRKQMMNRCWSRRSFATTGKAFPMIQVSVIKPIEMQCRIFSLYLFRFLSGSRSFKSPTVTTSWHGRCDGVVAFAATASGTAACC